MHVFKESKDIAFNRVGVTGKFFSTSQLISTSEFLLIDTEKGHETTIIEHKSDFIYYILDGSGYFEIIDTKEECAKGDLVVIPAGNKFTYKGHLKMLLIVSPPWQEDQEETL